MNNKGEISLLTIEIGFILLIVGLIFTNALTPIISGLFFGTGLFPNGSIGRLLLELLPIAPIMGIFYLWFRQG